MHQPSGIDKGVLLLEQPARGQNRQNQFLDLDKLIGQDLWQFFVGRNVKIVRQRLIGQFRKCHINSHIISIPHATVNQIVP
jgi:hypothetical protein